MLPSRFIQVFITTTAILADVHALTAVEHGMEMSVNAYDAVCWYEKLKQFPITDSTGFMRGCFGKAANVKKQLPSEDMALQYFGNWMIQLAMKGLPTEYGYNCNSFLENPNRTPIADHGLVIGDNAYMPYPFKGFAYCLIHQLKQKFGDKALQDVAKPSFINIGLPLWQQLEKTNRHKHWIQTILDRDNEFRAHHNVSPLMLDSLLIQQAQKWAEKNAAECQMRHSPNSYTDRQWYGSATGESLAAGGGPNDKEIAAYIASNGWYEEIKDYPYPEGYHGSGQDTLFTKIGHFTQTVWKDTKFVGYGYAYNPNCRPFTWFITARYSPPGNVEGEYQANVLLPITKRI